MIAQIPGYTVHPAAGIFPMLADAELEQLAADIRANGQRVPLLLWFDANGEEVLLDGRNRALACIRAGVKPEVQHYRGSDPLAQVISLNVARRHLSKSQLALAAARCMPMYKARAELRMKAGKAPPDRSVGGSDARTEAGRDFGVGGTLVQQATRVLAAGDEGLINEVELGAKAVGAAYDEIKRPGDPEDAADFEVAVGTRETADSADKPQPKDERGDEHARAPGESPGTAEESAGEDAPILVGGLEVDRSLSQWFTSPELADAMIAGIGIRPDSVLEPAAGSGELIHALHRRWPDVPVKAYEIDPRWADRLDAETSELVEVRCADGLTFAGEAHWALLNSPFEDGQDVDFLRHAMDHATCLSGVIRSSVLQGVAAVDHVWEDPRWSWDIKLLKGRPRFSGTRGSPRHEFAVVFGRYSDIGERRVTVEWWDR